MCQNIVCIVIDATTKSQIQNDNLGEQNIPTQTEPSISAMDHTLENEKQMSAYNFQHASEEYLYNSFNHHELSSKKLIDVKLAIPAYDHCIKASHVFNLLDSRGLVSASERQAYILRIRSLVQSCCKLVLNNNE